MHVSEYEPQAANERKVGWQNETLSNVLKSEPAQASDVAFGEGMAYRLGHEQHTLLEIYPDASMVRITSQNVRLELFRQEPPTLSQHGILFEQAQPPHLLMLAVDSDGEISFSHTPLAPSTQPVERPGTVVEAAQHTDTPITAETTRLAPLVTAEGHSKKRQQTRTQQPERAEQQRVIITGRVGRRPSLKETAKGLVAKFPLAEHIGEETHWHTVVAFGARAETIKDQLMVGQEVKVTGYLHERQARAPKDGTTKTVQEIYLASVSSVKQK